MECEKIEGVVIKGFNYQDHKRIFTLFTEKGLISCIATISEKKPEKLLLTTPLSRGEFCYLQSTNSLKKIQDTSLISSYLKYTSSYTILESASLCIQAVATSQIEHKAAPLLYKLLIFYLEKIPLFPNPQVLASSFMLKTLWHEGVFSLNQTCHLCEKEECRGFLYQRPYCHRCKIDSCIFFEEEQWTILKILLHCKELKFLHNLECSSSLHEKIKALFKDFFP